MCMSGFGFRGTTISGAKASGFAPLIPALLSTGSLNLKLVAALAIPTNRLHRRSIRAWQFP